MTLGREYIRIKVKVEYINTAAPVVYHNDCTSGSITSPSIRVRGDAIPPGWLGVLRDAFVGGKIHTGIAQAVQLVDIIQSEW